MSDVARPIVLVPYRAFFYKETLRPMFEVWDKYRQKRMGTSVLPWKLSEEK